MTRSNDPKGDKISNLSIDELFRIEGGLDDDMDEDCYAQQCVYSMLLCVSNLNECFIAY